MASAYPFWALFGVTSAAAGAIDAFGAIGATGAIDSDALGAGVIGAFDSGAFAFDGLENVFADNTSDLAATYASLILADEGLEITSEKILALTTAAGVAVEPIWASLMANALEGKDVKDLLTNVGGGGAVAVAAAPAASAGAAAEAPKEETKEEEKEESDDDLGFGLFD